MFRFVCLVPLLILLSVGLSAQCGDPAPCTECGESPDCILCDIGTLDGYCYTLPNENQISDLVGCPNVFNNDRWFGFIANATFVEIEVTGSNCQNLNGFIGIHGGLYGECIGDIIDVQCTCVNGAFTLEGPTTPGQVYWIGIDGCGGDICDIDIAVIRGAGGFELDDPESISGTMPGDDPLEICWGYQGYTFVVEEVFGATEYEWILPDGRVIIQSGTSSPPVDFPTQGIFPVCVTALQACDTSGQICIDVEIVPLPPDSLYEQICESDPCVPFDDGGCYNMSGFYDVQLRDANGCFFDRTLELLVIPENDTFLTEIVCEDDLPYTLPDGRTVSESGPYNATIQNAFGCDSFIVVDLGVLTAEISLGDIICEDGIFTINAVMDRSPYVTDWTAEWKDEDGNVVSDSLDLVTSEGGTYTLCSTIGALDFDEDFQVTCRLEDFVIEINDSLLLPQTPSFIEGLFVFCETGIFDYSAEELDNVDRYVWTLPPGAAIIGSDSTSNITLDLTSAISGELCVAVENACGLGDPFCRDILIVEDLTADAGADDDTCGLNYIMQAILAGNAGIWSQIDGPGNSTFDDPGSANTETMVDRPGSYTYEWLDSAGLCMDRDTVTILFREEPDRTDLVVNICDDIAESYVIEFTLIGGEMPYEIIAGGGSINGFNYTSDPIPSDSAFRVEIVDAFGCGPVVFEDTVHCDCITAIGSFDLDTLNLCSSDRTMPIYDSGDEVLDPNDSCLFVLHDGGLDSLGSILLSSDDGSFAFDDNLLDLDSVYQIAKLVGNQLLPLGVDTASECALIAFGPAVIWRTSPIAIAGIDSAICDFGLDLYAQPSRGEGAWTLSDGPAEVFFADSSDANTRVDLIEFGSYELIWTESFFGCTDRDTVIIDYRDVPRMREGSLIFDCNETNTAYTVRFFIEGGDRATYEVTGSVDGTLNAIVFQSDPIASGDSFRLEISDGFMCGVELVIDSFECPCISTPGQVALDTLLLCEDEIAMADYSPAQEVLDGNDIVSYVLHDGDTSAIIASSEEPIFGFDPGTMSYDELYFISAVAGDQGADGEVDLSSTCFRIGLGQPVRWSQIAIPTLSAEENQFTCQTDQIVIESNANVNSGNLRYEWLTPNGIIGGAIDQDRVTALAPGTYILRLSNGACTRTDSIILGQSEDLPSVMATVEEILTCSRERVTLDGTGSDDGDLFDHRWVNSSGDTISREIQAFTETPGVYMLFVRNVETACISSTSVEVQIDTASPSIVIADIGSLTCTMREAVIDAAGSDMGPDFQYRWSTTMGEILSDPTSQRITVSRAALYQLEITNTLNGCSSSRIVELVEEDNSLIDLVIDARDISCFGEDDGSIDLLEIVGGVEPLEISIDGGVSFTQNRSFSALSPGDYAIIVRDQQGCTISRNISLSEPEVLMIDAGEDQEILIGDEVELAANYNRDPSRVSEIRWSSNGFDSIFCQTAPCSEISSTPLVTTQYLVTIIDDNGCAATDLVNVLVNVSRDVYIPNVFSPNQDGVNDRLTVFAQRNADRVLRFSIYDRWGSKVFEEQNFLPNRPNEHGWDGSFKGEELNAAVYTVYAEVLFNDGLVKFVSGNVTLLR